jgi:pilus assembly protein CpaF
VVDEQVEAETLIVRRDGTLVALGGAPRKMEKFDAAGLDPMLILGAGNPP